MSIKLIPDDCNIFAFISQNKLTLEFKKQVTYYSMDDQILRKMLTEDNVIDWSTHFLIAGECRALKIRCLVKVLLYSVMN